MSRTELRKRIDRNLRDDVKQLQPETEKLMQERDIEGLVDQAVRSGTSGAVAALRELDDPRTFDLLLAALEDEEWKTRWRAAEALGKFGDPRALEPLAGALKGDAYMVRDAAATALAWLGDSRAVEPLREALNDPEIRDKADWAIGELS